MPLPTYSPEGSIGLLKRVSSGVVRLGSRFHPRETVRTAQVREFEMAHVPVLVGQYSAFLSDDGPRTLRWWSPALTKVIGLPLWETRVLNGCMPT